jgi:hypothetical protein
MKTIQHLALVAIGVFSFGVSSAQNTSSSSSASKPVTPAPVVKQDTVTDAKTQENIARAKVEAVAKRNEAQRNALANARINAWEGLKEAEIESVSANSTIVTTSNEKPVDDKTATVEIKDSKVKSPVSSEKKNSTITEAHKIQHKSAPLKAKTTIQPQKNLNSKSEVKSNNKAVAKPVSTKKTTPPVIKKAEKKSPGKKKAPVATTKKVSKHLDEPKKKVPVKHTTNVTKKKSIPSKPVHKSKKVATKH